MLVNADLSTSAKIPLWLAILININVVIGGAFFITAPKIGKFAGSYAPIAWLVGALVLSPVFIIFARLAGRFPHAGGIYVYSREAFGALVGFITGWTYFVGNSAGNALFIDAFTEASLNIPLISKFAQYLGLTKLGFNLSIILILILTSLGSSQLLTRAQVFISWLKFIPFCVVLIGALTNFRISNLTAIEPSPSWAAEILPIILFSYIGIEACSSIAHTIQNGSKNVARVTYISFFMITAIYALSHLGLILSMGAGSATEDVFARLAWIVGNNFGPNFAAILYNIVMFSMSFSYIGGTFSLINTDCWLLYSMTADFNNPIKNFFAKLNKHGQPINCILIQGLLATILLIYAQNQDWMTCASVVGVIFAFFATVLAYIKLFKQKHFFILSTLALASIAIMGTVVLQDFLTRGIMSALPMLLVFALGFCIFFADRFFKNNEDFLCKINK